MQTSPRRFQITNTKIIYSLIVLFIAGGILGYLIYSQRDILLTYDWDINWFQVFFSFIVFSLDLLLVIIVWTWLMNSLGKKIKFSTHFLYYSISNVTKRIPGTLWYIASRAQLYKSDQVDYKITTITSGVEYAIATIGSVLVCLLFAIPIIIEYSYSPFLFIVVILIAGFVVHPRVIDWIFRRLKLDAGSLEYRVILKSLVLYMLIWVLGGVVLFLIANSIYPLQMTDLSYVIGAWSIVGFITSVLLFLPTNLGLTEVGISLLLSNIMPSSIAVIIAILGRIFITIFELIWAGASLFIQKRSNNPKGL